MPKQYRNNPAKAFRSHRARQEIRKFQGKARTHFVPSMLFANMIIFWLTAISLESEGIIDNANRFTGGAFLLVSKEKI